MRPTIGSCTPSGKEDPSHVAGDRALRLLHVDAELELRQHQGPVLGRDRLYAVDPVHARYGRLDRGGDVAGDRLRVGRWIEGGDGDQWKLDLREKLHLERAVGEDPADQKQDDDQHGHGAPAQGKLGQQFHRRGFSFTSTWANVTDAAVGMDTLSEGVCRSALRGQGKRLVDLDLAARVPLQVRVALDQGQCAVHVVCLKYRESHDATGAGRDFPMR